MERIAQEKAHGIVERRPRPIPQGLGCMWLSFTLRTFTYTNQLQEVLQEDIDAEVGVSKKKGARLRTRKSIGGKAAKRAAENDSEDDFKPTKAPAKRKPAAEKPAPTKAIAKIEPLSEDEKPVVIKKKPVASSSKVKDESDSDAPVKASVLAKGKANATKRKR